ASRDYERKDTRQEADKALAALKEHGMQVNVASPESVQQMRETIAPVNEQIKQEVGADIWQAVQDELAAIRK
ncbi:MAG TPA: TRAP transporter substrate-binding protein, partial [Pusillimonas sp.]